MGAKELPDLKPSDPQVWIEPNGAIWVGETQSGRSALRETDLIEAGQAAGLVDNKIASFWILMVPCVLCSPARPAK